MVLLPYLNNPGQLSGSRMVKRAMDLPPYLNTHSERLSGSAAPAQPTSPPPRHARASDVLLPAASSTERARSKAVEDAARAERQATWEAARDKAEVARTAANAQPTKASPATNGQMEGSGMSK